MNYYAPCAMIDQLKMLIYEHIGKVLARELFPISFKSSQTKINKFKIILKKYIRASYNTCASIYSSVFESNQASLL